MVSKFLDVKNIKEIQLDITTLCNALCVFCPRTAVNDSVTPIELSINPNIPLKSFSLGDLEYVFVNNLADLKTLALVSLIPSYGDPLMVDNIIDIIKFITERKLRISMHTNGSMRDENFYKELASSFQGRVTFSIDGIGQVNEYYRKGAKYEKVIKNAAAFINAGGNAVWKTVRFGHNKHQIEKMRQLSKDMGFIAFRTTDNNGGRDLTPEEMKTTNKRQKQFEKKPFIKADPTATGDKIRCPWKAESRLFIDIDSNVWPCCYYGYSVYNNTNNPKTTEVANIIDRYGDFNSLKKHSLKEILEHDFFCKIQYDSVICNMSCKKKRFNGN